MIKYIVHIFHSRIDSNGNTYWAVRVISTRDRQVFEYQLGNGTRSQAERFVALPGEVAWNEYENFYTELSKRDFQAKTKDWQFNRTENLQPLLNHIRDSNKL